MGVPTRSGPDFKPNRPAIRAPAPHAGPARANARETGRRCRRQARDAPARARRPGAGASGKRTGHPPRAQAHRGRSPRPGPTARERRRRRPTRAGGRAPGPSPRRGMCSPHGPPDAAPAGKGDGQAGLRVPARPLLPAAERSVGLPPLRCPPCPAGPGDCSALGRAGPPGRPGGSASGAGGRLSQLPVAAWAGRPRGPVARAVRSQGGRGRAGQQPCAVPSNW